jgi:hypothetical protein
MQQQYQRSELIVEFASDHRVRVRVGKAHRHG